jgi:putative toxin-antitoxin system antitoxin component (TIGR02293 family)
MRSKILRRGTAIQKKLFSQKGNSFFCALFDITAFVIHIYTKIYIFMKMKQEKLLEKLQNPLELIELSRRGISKSAVNLVASKIGLSGREIARILNISERTFHRYTPDKQLDTNSTERLLKLMLLYQHGEQVFSNLEDFKPWMRQSMRIFGDKSALELLDTATGFEWVNNVLSRIEFGTYS